MMRRYGGAQRRLARLHGRHRVIDYVPMFSALVLAVQLLAFVPAAFGLVAAFDVVLVLGALGMLSSTTPFRLWPAVILFGITALWEWHVGWLLAGRDPA
jgi:hypothetical protein